jgi:hypothetical protein
MKKTVIVHDDYIEVLKDGYNIIENTIYDVDLVAKFNKLVKDLQQ